MRHACLLVLAVLTALGTHAAAAPPAEFTIRLQLQGKKLEGTPLVWNRQVVFLLGRDGWLWQFRPGDASDFQKTTDRFQPYSMSQMRAILRTELGSAYEVTATRHYLVAHAAGERDLWADRFEDLYNSFFHYWSIRGLAPTESRFPLVGVVFRNRSEFVEHARENGQNMVAGLAGYYEPTSNRIYLYDAGQGRGGSAAWQQNASTVIHEATHQTAFNTGIHSRFSQPPMWVAEGLATLFEAPGVYNARYHTDQADRINHERLADFRRLALPRQKTDWIATLVASDARFRGETLAAYAQAWALTFYLVETQPRQYAEYLRRTADRPMFVAYTAEERTADFVAVFGDNWRQLDAAFQRFMERVK